MVMQQNARARRRARATFIVFFLLSLFGCNSDINQTVTDTIQIKSSIASTTARGVAIAKYPGYDIIISAGQSNTHFGQGVDPTIDYVAHPRVFQLGRHGNNNLQIIAGKEPFEHWTSSPYHGGHAKTFAEEYVKTISKERKVLVIPGGMVGSGLGEGLWNPGDMLYADLIFRVNFALNNFSNSRVVAILWHQGEDDIFNTTYQQQLDTMITSMRQDIGSHGEYSKLPFLLGGFVDKWVETNPLFQMHENVIADTVNRLPYTAFASSDGLSHTDLGPWGEDIIHFSAAAQKQFGLRYFEKLNDAINNIF